MTEQQISFADLVRTSDRQVEPIDRNRAKAFVERIHYSRILPNNVVYSFGLFEGGELVGVVTYGVPASPLHNEGLAGTENAKDVLELNRLAIEVGKNGDNRASFLVSHSLKMLPNHTFVVSYADTGWTHIGYVYQACNFLYTGMSAKRVDTYQPTGKHSRNYDKNNHSDLHQTRNPKHRYVYLVGDKRTKKQMRKELRYEVYDSYPKGDERRYDPNNPQIAIPIRVVDAKTEERRSDLISRCDLFNAIAENCGYNSSKPLESYTKIMQVINDFPTSEGIIYR